MTDAELVTPRERSALHRSWTTWLPLALVVISLLSLAFVPLLVQRRTNALRDQIASSAEPSRALIAEIQGSLALETAGARGFLLTGDEGFVARHREAQLRRRQAERRLLPLTQRLGPNVAQETLELSEQLRAADALLDSLFEGRLSRADYQPRLIEQQSRLEAAVAGTTRLDQMLAQISNAKRTEIRAAERIGLLLTIGL